MSDADIASRIEAVKRTRRLERAATYKPEMILEMQDALLDRVTDSYIASGSKIETARINAQINFDIWEHNALNRFGRK